MVESSRCERSLEGVHRTIHDEEEIPEFMSDDYDGLDEGALRRLLGEKLIAWRHGWVCVLAAY